MQIPHKRRFANLYLLAFVMLLTTFAGAQLSTSVGNSVSPTLDTGLSSVAPTTSTEIEPGASNLLTPDERVPYDSIGANLDATPLSPAQLQYGLVSRMPFQVDNSLKDATVLTGQRSQLATRISGMLGRMSDSADAFSSRQPSASHSGLSSQSSSATPTLSPATSGFSSLAAFRPQSTSSIKSTGTLSATEISQTPQQPTQLQGSLKSLDKAANLPRNGKLNSRAGENSQTVQQSADQLQDFSKSPLESSANDDQNLGVSVSTSFADFNQKTFLNPNIISASHRYGSTKSRNPLATKTQTGLSASHSQIEFSSKSWVLKDQSAERLESRLAKV